MSIKYPKESKFLIALIAIVVLGALVRLPYLSAFPPLMLQDEAASGFNAVSIAETGRDEWGQKFPLIFKSFGDNKPPLFIYTTALLYKIVGWTPILPRLTSAIAGILLVFVISMWLKQIFKSKKIALLGAAITALSPWTIYLSRMALESNLGLLFFASGLLFLEYAKEKRTYFNVLLASTFFIFSAYTYHSYRLVTGAYLFITLIVSVLPRLISKKKVRLAANPIFVVFVISSVFILPGVLQKDSLTRFGQTSILQDGRSSNILDYYRGTCHVASAELSMLPLRSICALLWNQYSVKAVILAQGIAEHVSPEFLFFKGDSTINRNPAASGEFYIFLYPFLLMGIYAALFISKRHYLLLFAFFMTLIPSILTGPPHAIRLSAQIPFAIFLMVLGVSQVGRYRKQLIPALMGLLIVFSTYHLIEFSLIGYSESQQFLSHSREISQDAYRYYQQGYLVYIDPQVMPEPHIFFLFWNNVRPAVYHNLEKVMVTDDAGFVRPKQLGERLFLYYPNIENMIYDQSVAGPRVFITNREIPFIPDKIIYNNTRVHKFAAIYDIKTLRLQRGIISP
jgi:4-amino-4-deoxy-L-arabinose transferase-like glycosyltransferase